MADAVVSLLLENLTNLLKTEADLLSGLEEEVTLLHDQLKVMLAFLDDCQVLRQEHMAVKETVDQIRDIAYDAEDLIDTYILYAGQNWSWKKPNLVAYYKKLKTNHNLAKKMQLLKSKMDGIYDTIQSLGLQMQRAATPPPIDRRNRKDPTVEVLDVVGFETEANAIIERLTAFEEDTRLTVVSVVGMGGLGKTTLATKVYNDQRVKNAFPCHSWIYVSLENIPCDLVLEILRVIAPAKVTGEVKEMNLQQVGNILFQSLEGKKYLIVMDDVWKTEVWEALGSFFPDEKNGSRILFTTRHSEVATHASYSVRKCPPHFLRFLDKEESWQLFRKRALLPEDCSHQWEEVGRQLAERCCGLPLAIVVLGGLLSEGKETFSKWSKAAANVSNFLTTHGAKCSDILALSYNNLPYYLKPCFLYIGVFLEDSRISARELIQLWMAEGLIKTEVGERMEDTAERYLSMLVNRSLIQVSQWKCDLVGVKKCMIHDVLREFCIAEAQNDKFLQAHNSVSSSSPLTSARRLIGNSATLKQIGRKPQNFVKIRSLLCFNQTTDLILSSEWKAIYHSLQLLRVVKVGDVNTDFLPDEVGQLRHLRYLGYNKSSMRQLPSSIGDSLNLQTIDVRSKLIRDAPASIWKLKKLRHLHFQGQVRLPSPPSSSSQADDSSLKELQTLSTICPSSCTKDILSKVPNLTKLSILGDLKSHEEALSDNLLLLQKLQSLKLTRHVFFDALTCLPRAFPPALTKLTLSGTGLIEDPMPFLGKVKTLEILKLKAGAYMGSDVMVCSNEGFPKLQVLQLNVPQLKRIFVEPATLPNLEHLILQGCDNLLSVEGVRGLSVPFHSVSPLDVGLRGKACNLRAWPPRIVAIGIIQSTNPSTKTSRSKPLGEGNVLLRLLKVFEPEFQAPLPELSWSGKLGGCNLIGNDKFNESDIVWPMYACEITQLP